MVIDALCHHFRLPHPGRIVPPPLETKIPESGALADSPLAFYDPRTDSSRLKSDPAQFEHLRNHYPLRREPY